MKALSQKHLALLISSAALTAVIPALQGAPTYALGSEQLHKLLANDGTTGDQLGRSVATSEGTALLGAPGITTGQLQAIGAAYLFDVATGHSLHKLTSDNTDDVDSFGGAVAISGDIAIVVAIADDDVMTDSGAAYVFDVVTGNQLRKLKADDAGFRNFLGAGGVALSGDTTILGSPGDDDNGDASGAAYLFNIGTGNQLFKLKPDDGAFNDNFGVSVAISGSTALIGAMLNDNSNGNDSGAAYLFDTTTGNQLLKLRPNDGAPSDLFGATVAITGNTALVGAAGDDDNGGQSGSVYVFDVTSGNQLFKLKPDDGATEDFVGGFQAPSSIAIMGNIAIVGAYGDDDNGSNSGSVYLFDVTTGNQVGKIKPDDGGVNNQFGFSVGTNGSKAVIVGAPGDQDNGAISGSAYLFEVAIPEPSSLGALVGFSAVLLRRAALQTRPAVSDQRRAL